MECLEDVACSCSIAHGPFNPRSVADKPRFKNSPATKTQMYSSSRNPASTWRDIVREYSARELIYQGNKLPALAGLAISFKERFSVGHYVAGMWINTLQEDMAWTYNGDEATEGRPRRGSSWSWALAADGRVDWPDLSYLGNYHTFHGLVSCDTVASEEHTGSLSLSGTLLPVSLQIYAERYEYEQRFPLARQCNVKEHRRRHSEPQILSIFRLESPFRPISGSRSTNRRKRAREAESQRDTTMYGNFTADYRFWSSEEEI
ncbi:hypothetical protein EJ02DRAFT_214296 [Clathrospora elynae]|uniref:Uncharacterized protein n=1 Tax=Clathrospora elynae TaxID=706981 RepID=A0A6A5T715_9PLEO|nr:hypothetical protein EJ02DRAFT_214296 [Clathrospora elynae]